MSTGWERARERDGARTVAETGTGVKKRVL